MHNAFVYDIFALLELSQLPVYVRFNTPTASRSFFPLGPLRISQSCRWRSRSPPYQVDSLEIFPVRLLL